LALCIKLEKGLDVEFISRQDERFVKVPVRERSATADVVLYSELFLLVPELPD